MNWKSMTLEMFASQEEMHTGQMPNQSAGHIHFVNTPEQPGTQQVKPSAKIPSPLKILVLLSPPAQSHQQIRLFLQQQESLLIETFYPLTNFGLVEIDFTSDSSLVELRHKLSHNQYHVLYFYGMGLLEAGQPKLVMEHPETLEASTIAAPDFVEAVTQNSERQAPAIFLSFFPTTRNDPAEAFEKLSKLLIAAGVPAVVSPGNPVPVERATAFAKSFFWQIVEQQTVSAAFNVAAAYTQEIEPQRINQDDSQAETVSIPTLYLQEDFQQLCDWEAKPQTLQFSSLQMVREQDRLVKEFPENQAFVGRHKEKLYILQQLVEKTPVFLKGPRGIGKTTLAEHLVQRLMGLDDNIVPFFFDEKIRSAREILNALRDYLLEQGNLNIQGGMERYNTALEKFIFLIYEIAKKREPVFVFDNLDEFQSAPGTDFHEEFNDIVEIISYLCRVHRFRIICVSRYPLPETFDIKLFNLAKIDYIDFRKKYGYLDVENFQRKITGKKFTKFRQTIFGKKEIAVDDIVKQLYDSFNGNLRALELFTRFFDKYPKKAALVWEKWESYRNQTQTNGQAASQQVEMQQLLPQLIKTLEPRHQVLLGILSRFRTPVQLTAITSQFEAKKADENFSLALKEFFKTLNRLMFVETYTDKKNLQTYYYMTPGIKDLVAHVLPELTTVPFSHQRAGMYYFNCHKTMEQSLTELKESFHHYTIVNINEWVQTTGRYLANAYYKYSKFDVAYYYTSRVYKLLGEKTGALMIRLLGQILESMGKCETALSVYKRALAVSAEKENRYIESLLLNNVGQAYKNLGEYERSLSYLIRSLKISRDFEFRFLESENLYHIGHLYFLRGEKETALDLMEDSLLIKNEVADKSGKRLILLNISQIYQAMDIDETALEYLEESLELSREMKDKRSECVSLKHVANVYEYLNDQEEALMYLKSALTISREIGDKQCRHVLLSDIIRIYESRNEYPRVLTYLEESLENARLLGEKERECNILNRIGQKYIDLRNFQSALDYLHDSLKISQKYNLRREQAKAMYNLAIVAHANGNRATALDYFEKSLAISKEYGTKEEVGRALHQMGIILYSHGDLQTATNYLNESIRISQEINDRKGEAYKLIDLANFYLDVRVQQPHIAQSYLQQAAQINHNLNDSHLSQLLDEKVPA